MQCAEWGMAAIKAFKRTHVNLTVDPARRWRMLVVRSASLACSSWPEDVFRARGTAGLSSASLSLCAAQIVSKLHNFRVRRLSISQIKTVFAKEFTDGSQFARLRAVPHYGTALPNDA
jgi:hypothetical protein